MKHFIISFIFLLLSFLALEAQQINFISENTGEVVKTAYHPLLSQNKTWDEMYWEGHSICGTSRAHRTYLKGDTVIEGKTYHKVWVQSFRAVNDGPFCAPFVIEKESRWIPYYFVREDTVAKVVYNLKTDHLGHEEVVLYDFSLQMNDSVYNDGLGVHMKIVKVDSVYLSNGQARKRLIFDLDMNDPNNYPDTHIEGIGGSRGLFSPLGEAIGSATNLMCVKEGGAPIWGSQCNYYYAGLSGSLAESPLKVYPNPVLNQLNIKHTDGIKDCAIYDLSGKLELQLTNIHEDDLIIPVKQLRSGVYILEMTSENRQSGKIVHRIVKN